MTEMTLATATSAFESRFDHFLYATVREDPDGTPLTVLSVLARLGIEPWEEAARLAELPAKAAAPALAALISALPRGSATPPDSATVAARLITLLPRRSEREIAAHSGPSGGARLVQIPIPAMILARVVLCLIVLILLFASQWVVMSRLTSVPEKKPLAAHAAAVSARAAQPTSSVFAKPQAHRPAEGR